MPKLVSTDDLKDALTRFRERGDDWWLRRDEVDDVVYEAVGSTIGPLTLGDLEEVLEEIER